MQNDPAYRYVPGYEKSLPKKERKPSRALWFIAGAAVGALFL